MSPFCAVDVTIIRSGEAEAAFVRADCGCERFSRRNPATASIIAITTTNHTQRRRFLPGGDREGTIDDSTHGTGADVASIFLLRPVVCSSVIKILKYASDSLLWTCVPFRAESRSDIRRWS